MAGTPTRPGGTSAAPTSAAQTIASSGDRVRAFKSARRHSFLVRFLKFVLPIGALVAVAGYGGFLVVSAKLDKPGFSPGPIAITTTHLKMETPKYSGVSSDGARYEVRAREAITDLKMSGPVRLNGITGDISQPTGVVTNLAAVWGTYDTRTEVLELHEKIDIDGSTGMRVRMTRATIFQKEGRIVSPEPVAADTENGTITANAMTLLQKSRNGAFRGDVRVRLKPNPASRPETVKEAARKASPMPGLASNSGQPIDVQADELDIDDLAKTALFRNNVIARQADAQLEAKELDVIYEGNAGAPGQPKSAAPGQPLQQNRLKLIKARGNVVMTNKDDRATCELLEYDAAAERAVLSGGVTMVSGADRRATALKAEFDQKTDTALLVGDVVLTQARNVMRGRRLFVDRRKGTMRLESPPEIAKPAGRITTVFYQAEAKPGTKAVVKPVQAEPPATPLGANFKTDPNAPIEIEADTLDVTDTAKTAVFKVNVVAKQGEFTVRTAEMTAHYTGQAMAMTPGQPKATKALPGQPVTPATQLTRVEARSGVIVTGRDGQRIVGDWANFDVKANTVLVGGKRVTGSMGKNTVVGTRMLIDLTTGETRVIDGSPEPDSPGVPAQAPPKLVIPKGPAISAAESGTGPMCPAGAVCKVNRPQVLFFPEDAKAKAKQLKEQQRPGEPPPKALVPKQRRAEPAPWSTETAPRQ